MKQVQKHSRASVPVWIGLLVAFSGMSVAVRTAAAAEPASPTVSERRTANYPVRAVSPPSRVFVAGDDQSVLWRKTVSRVSAETSPTLIRFPDTNQSPPVDGLIETAWIDLSGPTTAPAPRRRSVIHFIPDTGGAWLETTTDLEWTSGDPLLLPSPLSSSSFFGPAQGSVRRASFSTADDGPSDAGAIHLAQYASMPPDQTGGIVALSGSDGITTLPPVQPRTWAPFSMPLHPAISRGVRKVGSDYGYFYSIDNLLCVTAAFGAGALMANTGFDTTMQNAWQTSVAPTGFGHFLAGTKPLGEGRYELAVWGTAAVTGLVFDESVLGEVVGEWGSRSLRTFAVGAPPLYVLQLATGASRPADGHGSHWHWFNDNNGVSGHAFIGAVPFLAAAEMVDNPWAKGSLYVCSTFCGLSRVDANAHYPSQVFLGWYLAFASSMAVQKTEMKFAGMDFRAVPIALPGGTGMGIEGRW